ncbi:hypothetical protein HJC23_012209 [Cyclotella cryptica]|uniref:Uncharacterized protein n=1 Tax=Cyclotella cryptica TaxID=29204 RepID=A0ABD3PU36_9STRA
MVNTGKACSISSKTTAAATKRKKEKVMKPNGKSQALSPVEERGDSLEQRDGSSDERCSRKCEREDADASPAEGVDTGASDRSRVDAKKRRAAKTREIHSKPSRDRRGSDEASFQYLSAHASSFDVNQNINISFNENIMHTDTLAYPTFPSLGSNSFGGLSFSDSKMRIDPCEVRLSAAGSNVSNTDDLGEPLTSISMSQDQAWEILNQDSFGFNLGQGSLSLSFNSDDDNLALPSPDRIGNRVKELTMENALDGTSGDLKKSIDLTTAVTESIDDPSTPRKAFMGASIPAPSSRDVGIKLNSFYPHHDADGIGHIPPTPPSTQSAPLSSSLPRKRESRDDRYRPRRSGHGSLRDGARDYDHYSHELSFHESKSEDYYYDRSRHLRSSGGKRSGTRSSSRRHRSHQTKPYHRSEEHLSASPPPLPNMGSAPSPRSRHTDISGEWIPETKRYKISARSSRHIDREHSRSDRWCQDGRDSHNRENSRDSSRHASINSCHSGVLPPYPTTTNGHPWHSAPIRPNARYPQSPLNAASRAPAPSTYRGNYHVSNPSYSPTTRTQAGAPMTSHLSSMSQSAHIPPVVSHPHPATHPGYSQQNNMLTPHGYPYPPHHHPNNHPHHANGNNTDAVHRAFLPPPPPQFTNKANEPANSNAPPREVYILSSNGEDGNSKPPPPPQYGPHSTPSSNAPPPLPPPHGRGPYHPYHPPPPHLPPTGMVTRPSAQPPLQGTSLLGPLTREQAPGIGWPSSEDALLTECMANHKSPVDWDVIAREHGRGRTARECHDRWTRYLKPGARKGQWREEEDAIVLRAIAQSSEPTFTQWADLAPQLPGRSGKQIRDRWVNYLNPAINHLPFSREDDLRLWEGHNKLGKRWVEISVKVFNSTRSENHIKNRWYSAAFKKFIANEFGPNAYVDAKPGE